MADVPNKSNTVPTGGGGFLAQAIESAEQNALGKSGAEATRGFSSSITVMLISGRSDWGLAPQNAIEIVRALKPAGFKFIIAAPSEPPRGTEFRKFANTFIPIRRDEFSLRDLLRLIKYVRRLKPNVIHSHGRIGGFYSRILGTLTGIKVVHSFHGLAKKRGFQGRLYDELEKFLARSRFVAVFSSDPEAMQALEAGVLLQKRPRLLIERAIDLATVPKRKKAAFSDASQPLRIGSILRSDRANGGDLYLSLAQKLEGLGQWTCSGSSKDAISRYKVSAPRLEILGPQTDPFPWLQSLDIYVCSSRPEGGASGVLEAMAAGCICVLSDIPAHRPFVGAHAALFFNPEDPSTFAGAVNALREDIGLRNSLLSNGRYYLERFHSSETFYENMIELYRTTIRGW